VRRGSGRGVWHRGGEPLVSASLRIGGLVAAGKFHGDILAFHGWSIEAERRIFGHELSRRAMRSVDKQDLKSLYAIRASLADSLEKILAL
jgi:hypothetical protein